MSKVTIFHSLPVSKQEFSVFVLVLFNVIAQKLDGGDNLSGSEREYLFSSINIYF